MGLAESLDEIVEEGRKEGREEGIQANRRETARKMKEAGSETAFISQITGLSPEEIEKL